MVGGPEDGAGPSSPSRASRSNDDADFGIGLHGRRRPRSLSADGVRDGREKEQLNGLDHMVERSEGEETSNDTTLDRFWHRAGWLVLLLAFQSCSSFVLERFEVLITTHPVIIFFLTMLVGAGGNVGGQSVLLVIRRLAVAGQVKSGSPSNTELEVPSRAVCNELSVGLRLAVVLLVASAARCEAFEVRGLECLAICTSMMAIVVSSALLGVLLPLVFQRLGIDPAHASAAIGVLMDGIGVTLTCVVSCLILGLPVSGGPALEHIGKAAPESLKSAIQVGGSRRGLSFFGSL